MSEWQTIGTAPTKGHFIAAIEVCHNTDRYWEQHIIWIDDETGDVALDCDQGWSIGDYSHWMPLPAPPAVAKEGT